jgi:hypothetical protein
MRKNSLKPEVAAKYNLVGVEAGRHGFAGLGEIDLCEMDLPLADQLVAGGFPFLVAKKKPAALKKPE